MNINTIGRRVFTTGIIPSVLFGEKSEKLFICVHGKYGSKEEAESFAQIVIPRGYQVLAFDLPGHGERKDEDYPCTVQNGVKDLCSIYDEVKNSYKEISLYACSLGAYFSLLAYSDIDFKNSLFISPILSMERLIQNMMKWSGVTEERLQDEKIIATSFGENLSWDYYEYVKQHPVNKWDSPTSILYGENDNLTEKDILENFVKEFNCKLEIMKNGEHYFHTPEQVEFLNSWFKEQEY